MVSRVGRDSRVSRVSRVSGDRSRTPNADESRGSAVIMARIENLSEPSKRDNTVIVRVITANRAVVIIIISDCVCALGTRSINKQLMPMLMPIA
jgi:hypothetical protein